MASCPGTTHPVIRHLHLTTTVVLSLPTLQLASTLVSAFAVHRSLSSHSCTAHPTATLRKSQSHPFPSSCLSSAYSTILAFPLVSAQCEVKQLSRQLPSFSRLNAPRPTSFSFRYPCLETRIWRGAHGRSLHQIHAGTFSSFRSTVTQSRPCRVLWILRRRARGIPR